MPGFKTGLFPLSADAFWSTPDIQEKYLQKFSKPTVNGWLSPGNDVRASYPVIDYLVARSSTN